MTSSFLVWLQQDNGTWVTQHPVETLPLFLPDVAAEKEYKPFFLERKKIKKKKIAQLPIGPSPTVFSFYTILTP